MIVQCITDKLFGVNSYFVAEAGHCILIDPVDIQQISSIFADNAVDFAILTHEHYDHILGINELKQKYGTKVLCGMKAMEALSDPKRNMSRYQEYIVQFLPFGNGGITGEDYICCADDVLEDEQIIQWQGHEIQIKETPGHSIGSIVILIDRQFLFSGDIVFKDYPTATRLPGGSSKAFARITEPWLDSLPQELTVYPGHTEPFPLKERYRS